MAPITCYAFVDDSGDVGTRLKSKGHFVLGGYFVMPSDGQSVADELLSVRAEFGFAPDHVLHFGSYAHERRVRLSQMAAAMPITAFSVVLCKTAGPEKRPWTPEKLYNWMVRLALERCSWFFRRRGLYGSVTFEHMKGADTDKTHAYVERLKGLETRIEWDSLHTPVRFQTKSGDERLQVADTVASATGAAFEGFALDITETRYFRELAPRLWREKGQIAPYGLKIFPAPGCKPPCERDEGHGWVADLP